MVDPCLAQSPPQHNSSPHKQDDCHKRQHVLARCEEENRAAKQYESAPFPLLRGRQRMPHLGENPVGTSLLSGFGR